ncbi:MAG: c-type cytochrome [Nitrospira sp. CR2.1]|nr:c-type cytochrome [Nitrospira sp. CR2.1]
MNVRAGVVGVSSLLLVSMIVGGLGAAVEQAGNAGKGKALYANLCIRCHGVEGKGNGVMTFTPPVADLTAPAVQHKLDATLLKTIHDGRKNTAMGAWKFVLTEEEMRDVTAYVRVLGTGAHRTLP